MLIHACELTYIYTFGCASVSCLFINCSCLTNEKGVIIKRLFADVLVDHIKIIAINYFQHIFIVLLSLFINILLC